MSAETPSRGSEFTEESLSKWTPRFVANGIDYNDLVRIRGEIDDWSEWLGTFESFGEEHVTLGEQAEERGDYLSAGEHFVRASMYFHFGSYVWHEDADLRDPVHALAVETYRRGSEYLRPEFHRLEAPAPEGEFRIPANLHVPDDANGDVPLVLLLPGSDSIKEELLAYGRSLLDRDLAILAMDGPGQGETRFHQGMTPEYHRFASAVLDHVQHVDPDGVDVSTIGVYGVSLGGFYAAHVAANEPHIDACVSISGRYTIGPESLRQSDLHNEQYQWACRTDSMATVDEITERMTLRGDIEHLTAPMLVMTGGRDAIAPPVLTRRIADEAPNAEYVVFEEGRHVCNNIPYKARPYAADWLCSELS